MKKFIIAFAGIIMMLSLTACGDDEPKDQVWIMNTQLINHVTNNSSAEFVSATIGAVYVEFNITKMTANLAYSFAIGSDEAILNMTDVPMTFDSNRNGYLIKSTAPVTAGNHTVSNLSIFIDMNINGNEELCHWTNAIVDGKYELNGLVPIITFRKASTVLTKPDGTETTDNGGTYSIEVIGLTTEGKSATLNIDDVNIEPLVNGVSYAGINVEPTAEGLHFTIDNEIFPRDLLKYEINQLDLTVNFFTHTLGGTIDIKDVANLNVQGTY